MRILHINCNYIGTTLHQLMVEKLDSMGYENQVFVPTYDKKIAVIQPNANVIVSECFKKRDRLVFDYKQQKIYQDIQQKIDISAYDCIHAYTLFTDGNCARRLSRKYNIPYIVAIRNTDVNNFFAKMIHLRGRGIKIMRDAKAIFFLSEAYRKQVFKKYVPSKYKDELFAKTYIIPNGIDEFWFDNIPVAKKKYDINNGIKIVYAGRIDKNKNILTTQKAMKILREKGYSISLTVVGKVHDKTEFERISKDPYTICLPAMSKEKLIEVYRSSDIFVMPSYTESFGLVYAEAMTQGLPIVYSKDQGFDGQFLDGLVGYSVLAESAKDIADRIECICERYEEMSRQCLVMVNKFRWGEIVKQYLDVYVSINNT